jgi:hypothetical protein
MMGVQDRISHNSMRILSPSWQETNATMGIDRTEIEMRLYSPDSLPGSTARSQRIPAETSRRNT